MQSQITAAENKISSGATSRSTMRRSRETIRSTVSSTGDEQQGDEQQQDDEKLTSKNDNTCSHHWLFGLVA